MLGGWLGGWGPARSAGWLGGCQPPARFAKCGVGAKLAAKLLRRPLSSSSSYLLPLSFSRQKWGSFGQTERRTRTERHLLAPSRAFYHRENLPASFICTANWATNLGLTQGVGDGIPFSRGSLASFALALLQRFESSIRGPFFAAADIALRFTALGPTTRPRPADAEGVKSLGILWCDEVS